MADGTIRQTYKTVMGKNKARIGIIVLIAILVVAGAICIYSLNLKYAPPSLEKNVVSGVPNPSENYLYGELKTNFDYSISMAANLYQQEDGSVNIYLTNPADSEVSIMCEIYDMETDELYYKCGRIEPGYYIESLEPISEIENVQHDVVAKIYAFGLEDYTSAGTTELNLVLQPW